MACNKNPLLLIVPCHRVVGANGKLVGFAYGTEAKRWLLELEVK
jgi:methylated-DNA-[protein]-cysteine S-methyltransferase